MLGDVAADPAANTILARLKTLSTLIGEAQVAPTANTLLARLKSLEDKIDKITAGTTPAVTTLSGSLVKNETNKAVTLNTDIFAENYTADKSMTTTLMVETNTSGVLLLEVDGVLASLNGGASLDAGKWYAFDIPMLSTSVYNLQFSVNTTLQIKWIGGL